MKLFYRWRSALLASAALMGVGLADLPTLSLAIASERSPSAPLQLAQASTLCRRIITPSVVIFERPNTGSRALGELSFNSRVELAPNNLGSQGEDNQFYLQITAPQPGYIVASQRVSPGSPLVSTVGVCTTAQGTPPASGGSCRVAVRDLVIRPQPAEGSTPIVGGVASGSQVTLTGRNQTDSAGRTWVQISQPRAGWVSGSRGGGSNLRECSR